MEHGAYSEETGRFAIALAAAEAASRHVAMIDGPIDKEKRAYFYAVPDGEGARSVVDLSKKIERHDVPVLVDWDKNSETYGLRYTLSSFPIPSGLQGFRSDEAKSEWRAWKVRQEEMDGSVLETAKHVAAGGRAEFLDIEVEGKASGRKPGRDDIEM